MYIYILPNLGNWDYFISYVHTHVSNVARCNNVCVAKHHSIIMHLLFYRTLMFHALSSLI